MTAEDEAALVDWKEDRTPRPKVGAGEEDKGGANAKPRLSSASAVGDDVGVGSSVQPASKSREKSESSPGAGRGSAKKKRRSAGG